ncbi:MAG TPA: Fe-S cluster assembly protein HesB [Candidatus Dormibacteraeota bacterium]
MTGWRAEFALLGPGGEPVDLHRVFVSHGLAALPPMRLNLETGVFEITVPVGSGARTLSISASRPGYGQVAVAGASPGPRTQAALLARTRLVLSLDQDLSPFYALAKGDPELSWVTAGAGRMVRSPTVFEDVVKTICTTNTSWAGTTRMVNALIEHLGVKAPGAPAAGPFKRTFPTAAALAAADLDFYRRVVGAGYRGAYLRNLAISVVAGSVDIEHLGQVSPEVVSDDDLEARLLQLPGVGPYAAAHIMLMLGRHSRLILDSWTRPTYARLIGRGRPPSDATIERRFRRYGRYAGLAFWLFLTRDWVDAPPASI